LVKMSESGRSSVGKRRNFFLYLLAPILQPLLTVVVALPPMNEEEDNQRPNHA